MATEYELLERRRALSTALYAIHRESFYYSGFTDVGLAHLDAGGAIGPDDMPMSVGMQRHECCIACHHERGQRAWPCETVKLLLEAGVIEPFRFGDHAEDWSETQPDFSGVVESVNIRPDKRPEIRRFR